MAATVIDELVVLLDLDSSKISDSRKKVAEEFVRLKSEAGRANQEIHRSTESLASALGQVQGRLLAIAALFLGGMGIKQFAMHVADLTNQLGRLAPQAGMTTMDLSAWGDVGRMMGASPQAVRAGVMGMAAAGNQVEPNVQLIQTLAAMGMVPQRLPNGDFDVNGALMGASRWAAQQRAAGWGTGRITGTLMRLPGMNQDLASVIEQGPEKLQAMLDKMGKFGPTPEQVKAIQDVNKAWGEMQTKFERFARELETHFAPVITWLIDKVSNFFDIFHKNVTDPDGQYDKLHKDLEKKFGTVEEAGKAMGDPGLGERFRRWVEGGGLGHVTPRGGTGGAAPQPGVNGAPTPGETSGTAGAGAGGIDRSRFRSELERNPALRAKVMAIAAGENNDPNANVAVMETMMNRAAMAGTTLAAQARTTAEGGYYAGYNPGAVMDPKRRAILERNLETVLGGSNVSNYATDNASNGNNMFAERERQSGKFILQSKFNGEYFFSPGWGGGAFGPRSRAAYETWRKGVANDDKIWATHGGLFLGNKARNMNVMGNSTTNTTQDNRQSHTSVGEVHVHVPNGSPYDIAQGIHGALINTGTVAQANTGPW